jgi:hypothetical protein
MSDYFSEIIFNETPDASFPSMIRMNSFYTAFADLNLDGKKDIVVHIWGGLETSLSALTAEKIDDSVIVYISNSKDDTYEIGNSEIFGQEEVSLGGAMSRAYEIEDFNSDGYPDIAYAMNLEDGRPHTEGFKNLWSEIAVIMSNGDGTYRVDIVDPPQWHHTLTSMKVEGENPIILFTSINSTTDAIAIQYRNGNWEPVSGLPPLTGGNVLALESELNGKTSDYIFTGKLWNFENKTIPGLWKLEDGSWKLQSQLEILPTTDKVLFEPWGASGGGTREQSVFQISDSKVIEVAIYQSEKMNLFPDEPSIILAMLSGSEIESLDRELYRQNDLAAFNYFVGYRIESGNLVLLDKLVVGQNPNDQSYHFSVADINGDGYDDLISYGQDRLIEGEVVAAEKIAVFINDRDGKLVRDDDFEYPLITHGGAADDMLWPKANLIDLNSDGVLDIFYQSTIPKKNPIFDYATGTKLEDQYNNDYIRVFLGDSDQFMKEGINLAYSENSDTISGSAFGDVINAKSGNDYISSGDGDDIITSGSGSDIVFAGNGKDIFNGLIGSNIYSGGNGIDTVNIDAVLSQDSALEKMGNDRFRLSVNSDIAELISIERVVFNDRSIAIDIDGNAGITAKVLGAFLGEAGVSQPDLVGLCLDLLDRGLTYEGLLGQAINAFFGSAPDGAEIVRHFYQSLTGQTAPEDLVNQYAVLIDGGSLATVDLAKQVAEHELNIQNIGLIGLTQTGLDYI